MQCIHREMCSQEGAWEEDLMEEEGIAVNTLLDSGATVSQTSFGP